MGRFLLFLTAAAMLSSCSTDDYTAEILSADSAPESHVSAPSGRTRSYGEALEIARRSIGIVDGTEVMRAGKARTIRDGRCVTRQSTRNGGIERTDTLVYVFNFNDNAGFSIIAADRCVSPVLVVTEQGNYEYGQPTGIEGFDNYMDSMTAELTNMPDIPIFDFPREYSETKIIKNDKIGPLCTTKWDQDGVFGAYCSNDVAGCSSIAMAQIMAYWEYPDSITTTYTDKNNVPYGSLDGQGYTVDRNNPNAQHIGETFAIPWVAIKNHKSGCSSATCEQNHWKISALLRQIGELNNSIYYRYATDESKNKTSIKKNDYGYYLRKFGYSEDIPSCPINYDWNYVCSELNNSHPLIIEGSSNGGGHTWILDGYIDKDVIITSYELDYIEYVGNKAVPHYKVSSVIENIQQLVHFNWGWGGECNGYFATGISFKTTDGVKYDSSEQIVHNLDFSVALKVQGGIHP